MTADEGVRFSGSMRPARNDPRHAILDGNANVPPRADAEIRADLDQFGMAGTAGIHDAPRRRVDDTNDRYARPNERDIDGEVAALVDEFLGAVERVDQKERVAHLAGRRALARLFLGHDGNVRERAAQALEDDPLGVPVGGGDRRGVRFLLDAEVTGIDHHHGAAGRQGQGLKEVEHCGFVSHRSVRA